MESKWPMVKLEKVLELELRPEIVDVNKQYQFAGIKSFGKGVFKANLKNGFEIKSKKLFKIKKNDFMYMKIMAWEGAFGLVPEELDGLYVSGQFPTFIINQRMLLPKYIDYFFKMKRTWEEAARRSSGTNVRRRALHIENFLEIEIPLPPLEEQERIVARIEELLSRTKEARRLRAEAVREAEDVIDMELDKIFKTMNFEPKRLGDVTSKIGSGSTPKGGRANYPDSGVFFIRSLNIGMRKFQWKDIAFIHKSTHESMKSTHVYPNDVLLNITGASIGRVACAPIDIGEANVNQHVSIIRPLEMLDSRYLMYWLSTPETQKLITQKKKGATREALTKKQIEEFPTPLPPLETQCRIVAYLDSLQAKVDELKKLQKETEREMEELVPSILDKAFKGEM